jgi:predicted lipoprotein
MPRTLSLLAGPALILALALPAAAAPADNTRAIVTAAVDGFVRPAYIAFHASTKQLRDTVGALCTTPSPGALKVARDSFAGAVAAWSKVEIIRFGPVTEGNRLERILFWPDRKSIGLKQVQAALADEDSTATDATRLAGKSVAMQGLGALEFVLFGTDSDALAGTTAPYRCAYGAAIGANLDTMAGDIETAWAAPDGFAAAWEDPGPDNALYRTDDEALGELFDVFVNGLELVRDVRVNGFLGAKPDEDKPRQALFWRSAQTAPSLAANVAGMKDLFDASGLGAALPEAQGWIVQSIEFEFGNALRAAGAADGPVAEVLADPQRRGKLDYFRVVTSSLSELFGTRLSAEYGVTSGFSSLDGD